MSLLYKDNKYLTYKVDIKQDLGKIHILFTSDCGKFGTDEVLDSFELTPLELLTILQTHYDENNK